MNGPSALISVIIPCYNAQAYLAEAIDSALNQSHTHIEVLVIDDGSTDNSARIAKSYKNEVRLIYLHKENSGLSSARNLGIQRSSGPYIALLDADDRWEPHKLSRQIETFQTAPSCGMVFTDYSTFDSQGLRDTRRNVDHHTGIVEYSQLLSRSNFIYPSTVLIRRSVFDVCGNFDESLRSIEDYDMWLRIAQKFEVRGVREPLTTIRIHEHNMSGNLPVMLKYETKVVKKHRQNLSWLAYNRRIAKAYFLNADRSIHQEHRLQALYFFILGLIRYPLLPVDISIFVIKFILGKNLTERLKRRFANTNSVLARWYRWFYVKY
jgi:glycosyltransferase involved in cell wall biosynthesis